LPPYVDTAACVVPHHLAQFLLIVGLAAFYFSLRDSRQWLMAVSALSFACAAATRPGFQLAGPVIAFVLLAPSAIAWMKKERFGFPGQVKGAVLLAALSAVTVLGYSTYNKLRFGYFGMTPLLGHNLAVRATPFYERIDDQTVRDLLISARNKRYDAGGEPGRAVWDVHVELMRAANNSRVVLAHKLQPLMTKVLRAEKFDLLREVTRSFAAFWVPKSDFGWGFRVGNWWDNWDRTLITFKDFRFVPNRTPAIVRKVSTLIEAGIILLFFGTFFLCAGAFCTALWFGELRGHVEPATAVTYSASAMIVFYNALVNCIVDQGDLHQRLATEGCMILCVVLGAKILSRLRVPA